MPCAELLCVCEPHPGQRGDGDAVAPAAIDIDLHLGAGGGRPRAEGEGGDRLLHGAFGGAGVAQAAWRAVAGLKDAAVLRHGVGGTGVGTAVN